MRSVLSPIFSNCPTLKTKYSVALKHFIYLRYFDDIQILPKSISRRLSSNSSNVDIFNKNKHIYDKALKHSGYRQALEFIPPKDKSKHKSRNIIWFNAPYNKDISSNIGRDFLNLISKHFPINSPLAKIFDKNNIKVSYSFTYSMSQRMKKNITKKLHPPTVQHTSPTNAIVRWKAYAPY